MKTKPTIRDIANAAGVTPATVSYVLNQNARQTTSAQTRERVLAAAREMGYLPSAAAKVVRGSPSCCVGVAIEKDLNTNRFNLVLQGIRDQMEQRGYNLMLCGFDRRHSIYPDYIRNALEGRIDGVIFIGKDNEGPSAQAEALVLRHQIPFVVYDCGLEEKPYSIVSSPRQALENVLVLGVADAGFFSGWLNREAKPGDRFRMSEPSGEFHYETLRDKKQIVCVAGGAGITPFLSMAKSMLEGDEDYEMVLFYGARDEAHLACKAELDAMAQQGLRVVYVLSDEEKPGFEHGFVTAQLMEKYADLRQATFFLCGPKAMYDFVGSQLAPYGLPLKAVRRDATCCGDLEMDAPRSFKLTVHIRDRVYTMDAAEHETLLTAMERAGVPAPNKCRAGGCGYCHSKLLSGEFRVAEGRDGRREADRKFGYVHPCVTYPLSDMAIEVPAEE